MDPMTGNSRGYGFVRFTDEYEYLRFVFFFFFLFFDLFSNWIKCIHLL